MKIVASLHALLEPLRSPDAAAWQMSYMRELFPFLGIRTPALRKAVLQLKREFPSSDWKKEVRELWRQPEREFHYGAIFWAIAHRGKATAADLPFYEELLTTNSWWDSVDTIAPHLVGELFRKFPSLIEKTEEWVDSPQLWLRRSALIYSLSWKGATDAERLFRYCTKLGKEKEFFIRKAIGWALREYSKTNPTAVSKFLQTADLSPLSLREARKRLLIKKK